MRKIVLAVSLVVPFVSIKQSIAADPSFDCAKASQRVEHVICQSDQLSRQDLKLSRLYNNIMDNLPADVKMELKAEQLAWLSNRNQACDLEDKKTKTCLLEHYRKRNSELSSLLAFDSSERPNDDELNILRVTPTGDDVPAGRQIVFQFDRPVVPIGRMERRREDVPVSITPELNCEWRWLNTSALACQLRNEDKMTQATRYEVVMSPGIKTESGVGLKRSETFSFTTTRPKVTYTRFVNWLSPGTPLIQVTFNQAVTQSSVEQSLFFKSRRKTVGLFAHPDNLPRRLPHWLRLTNDEAQPGVDDRLTEVAGEEVRRVWVIEAGRELGLDERVSLQVKPGLQSSEGPERGIEHRTVVNFDTFPEFEFLGIRCTLKGERIAEDLLWKDLKRESGVKGGLRPCAPLRGLALLFSSPVKNSIVKDHAIFTPGLDGGRKDYDPWENTGDWTRLAAPHRKGRYYQVWLPELLQAYQKYGLSLDKEEFIDEFARKLNEEINFEFFTGHREANLKLAHGVAVLEKDEQTDVPLYVTNLDSVNISYDRLGDTKKEKGLSEDIQTEKVEDVAYAMPLGVRGLIADDSGAIFGTLHPNPAPPNWYSDPSLFAQVTPYQVHFKAGHFNSIAWVTELSSGLPLTSARVSLHVGTYNSLTELQPLNINASTDENGIAELPGLADIDPDLKKIHGNGWNRRPSFFIKVEKDNDIAVIPLNYSFMVRGDGVYSRLQVKGGHTHTWGTTAQGIYKLGDTIDFKIYVREQSQRSWIAPARESYELQVIDPQGKTVFEQKAISLSEFGAFDGNFKVAEQGVTGWYRFVLTPTKQTDETRPRFTWQPMSVLISDFTPAPFKVSTELNGKSFKAGDQVEAASLASMHAGGPYTGAEVRLTARLSVKPFRTNNPVAEHFTFGSHSGKNLNQSQSNLLDIRGRLDDFGQYENAFIVPETDIYYGTLMVESAVKDERGKFVSSSSRADYAGRSRFVGLKNTRWLYEKDKLAHMEVLVVDKTGQTVEGATVSISINHREYKASRVKGPGNAYLTQNIMQWVKETSCEITSRLSPTTCEFSPKHPGYYQFVASTEDEQGRQHQTILNAWVTGAGKVVWDQSNDATLQVIAEQTEYKIGDIARYLIKNPFPGAKALVSVERYGVLDSWVETLETSTPVIEVPVKPDYLPGFYLSVVAISPRVERSPGPGMVDLGKPGYRMGYVKAKVSDPFKQLDIDVQTAQESYKPRDTVKARIHVESKSDSVHGPYEIAVAVVDESVLAMNRSGGAYYDPYEGFNRLDALDVNNYSLLSRLVGRQKFEKKGANPGGDGGSAYTQLRNLFKFVSYWNPSIRPDVNGNAEIEFEVPDNLTGWRIFALAVTPSDRMGLGETSFKVNRETEIRPVMPNQLTEGDEFMAGFSVMNRTDKIRDLNVTIEVSGPLTNETNRNTSYDLRVAPYKREKLWLPLTTRGYGELLFRAEGGDTSDKDAVEHKLRVNKRRSLETAATYGTTTENFVSESVKVPEGIYTDVGEIGAVFSPTVIGNIDGAFTYIRNYPYLCWEQRLTKATFASSYMELKEYLDAENKWTEPGKDITRALSSAANFQAPNGGMVYWIPSNRYVSPYLSAYTAMAFNWLRNSGHEIPVMVEERLHEYLLALLRKNEFPSFYNKGMSSSVRAVALAALSESGKITLDDIERYERHVPEMDLFGQSHYLQAAIKTSGVKGKLVDKLVNRILGHASQTGGKFQFNEVWDDSYKYILSTPLRSNCSVLSSLIDAQTEAQAAKSIGDIPFKLVRSITQSRGNRNHWENTQENVFCMNALLDYARLYESEEPAMTVRLDFDGSPLGTRSFSAKTDPMVKIFRPIGDKDPGTSAKLEITKEGQGRLYYSARIAYDLKEDNAARINSGIEIRREYSVERQGKFVLLQSPMDIRRGELVKVDLFVSVPTARHFVVVNDPVPGGLEPVNTDLATHSEVDAAKGKYKTAEGSWFYNVSNWSYYGRYFWSFYHKELRHDSARFYADYLPAGNYHLSYTAQSIAEGRFSVMPTHAEEMYDPDVYGKSLPARLHVSQ